MVTIYDICDQFETFLTVKYPSHFQKFKERRRSSPEAARAEAALFSILRENFEKVTIAEDISTGGVDFLSERENEKILFEVTSLGAESLGNRSNMPHQDIEDGVTRCVASVISSLRNRVSTKAPQMSNHGLPTVLAITTEHYASAFLLGTRQAEEFFVGGSSIRVPFNSKTGSDNLVSRLDNSPFFRFSPTGEIEYCRRHISAILLIGIEKSAIHVLGLLHPEPKIKLPSLPFENIPFLQATEPIESGKQMNLQWVVKNPVIGLLPFKEIELRDKELREI